jgi:hypothetical protein
MSSVERHDAAELSYAVFCERFFARNQPVILTSAVQGMACFDEGLAGIEQRFGDVQVPVVGDAALLAAPMTSILLHERDQLKTCFVSCVLLLCVCCAVHQTAQQAATMALNVSSR